MAKELKAAGFPVRYFQVGHKFYPHENSPGWSKNVIEACGKHFAPLYVEAALWTAESDNPPVSAVARSCEEAVAKLWLALQGR